MPRVHGKMPPIQVAGATVTSDLKCDHFWRDGDRKKCSDQCQDLTHVTWNKMRTRREAETQHSTLCPNFLRDASCYVPGCRHFHEFILYPANPPPRFEEARKQKSRQLFAKSTYNTDQTLLDHGRGGDIGAGNRYTHTQITKRGIADIKKEPFADLIGRYADSARASNPPHSTAPNVESIQEAIKVEQSTKKNPETTDTKNKYLSELKRFNTKNGVHADDDTLIEVAEAFSTHDFAEKPLINYQNHIARKMVVQEYNELMRPELFDTDTGLPSDLMKDSLTMAGDYWTPVLGQYIAKKSVREDKDAFEKFWDRFKEAMYYFPDQDEPPICPNATDKSCHRAINLWGLSDGRICTGCCNDHAIVLIPPCLGPKRKQPPARLTADVSPQVDRLKGILKRKRELESRKDAASTAVPKSTTPKKPKDKNKTKQVIVQDPLPMDAPLHVTVAIPARTPPLQRAATN